MLDSTMSVWAGNILEYFKNEYSNVLSLLFLHKHLNLHMFRLLDVCRGMWGVFPSYFYVNQRGVYEAWVT